MDIEDLSIAVANEMTEKELLYSIAISLKRIADIMTEESKYKSLPSTAPELPPGFGYRVK